jgi:hypothetical protein
MDDEGPTSRPGSPKAEAPRVLTEAELSRIAREAVHQAPDARLDRQLARMGLTDASEAAEVRPAQPTNRSVAIDPELERLRRQLRRLKTIAWALAAFSLLLAVVVVALLVR